jgi:hypothetical protein
MNESKQNPESRIQNPVAPTLHIGLDDDQWRRYHAASRRHDPPTLAAWARTALHELCRATLRQRLADGKPVPDAVSEAVARFVPDTRTDDPPRRYIYLELTPDEWGAFNWCRNRHKPSGRNEVALKAFEAQSDGRQLASPRFETSKK